MMKNQKLLLITLISLLIFILTLSFPLKAGYSIYYYPPFPQGEIGITNPEIGWKVLLLDNELQKIEFTINGTPVEVEYNEQEKVFYAKVNDKLLAKNNEILARLKLKNWSEVIEKKWEFAIADSALNNLPVPDQQQFFAINYANDYRYLLDNPLYKFNSSLNMAAQKHADYLAKNNIISHTQEKNTPGFFGETVVERTMYYGFFGNVSEDISYQGDPSIQEAIDNLFDAPYHRIPFLMPDFINYGYGINSYYQVLNFGSKYDTYRRLIAYPGPNNANVPIAWKNYETPNPLRFFKGSPKKVGYPIVVGVYGEKVESIKLNYANLWDENDIEVPVYINSPKISGGNDEELNKEIILIPQKPLALSSKYKIQVSIEVKYNSNRTETFDNTWTFQTESVENEGKKILHEQISYPTTKSYKSTIFSLGQRYVVIDNKPYPLDVVPFIENNRTMVPFRALGTTLGAKVNWDSSTQSITYQKENIYIELPVNSTTVKINGKPVLVDQGAILRDGRSFVPIRFISEQLDTKVKWLPDSQEVFIEIK